jgi:transposase-like protein
MAGRPQSKTGISALAREWKVSPAAVHKWAKLGCPVDDIETATQWRQNYLNANASGSNSPQTLNEARREKLILEKQLLQLRIEKERRELVSAKSVEESGIRIGAIIDAKLNALVPDCAPILAGLDERGVTQKMKPIIKRILSEIRDELEKL